MGVKLFASVHNKYFTFGPRQLAELLSEFDGVELHPRMCDIQYVTEFKKHFTGIVGFHGTSLDDTEELTQLITALLMVQEEFVMTIHPCELQDSVKENYSNTVRNLMELQEKLADLPVQICIENLNSVDGISRFNRDILFRMPLDVPDMLLTYDIGHHVADYGFVEYGVKFASVKNLHIHGVGSRDHELFSSADIDYKKVVATTIEKGFTGNVIVEIAFDHIDATDFCDAVRIYTKEALSIR